MRPFTKVGMGFVAMHQLILYRQESKKYQANLAEVSRAVAKIPHDRHLLGFHGGERTLIPKPGTHLFLSGDPSLAVAYAGRYTNPSVSIVTVAADTKLNVAHANITTNSDGFQSLNGFRSENPNLPVDVRRYSAESLSVAVDRFPNHKTEIQEVPVQPINPNALLYRMVNAGHQLLT